jgi:hypothetical protein
LQRTAFLTIVVVLGAIFYLFVGYYTPINATATTINSTSNEFDNILNNNTELPKSSNGLLSNISSLDNQCISDGKPSSVSLATDKRTYTSGQPTRLDVRVYDNKGCRIDAKVLIEANITTSNPEEKRIHKQSGYPQSDDFFYTHPLDLEQTGIYEITATVPLEDGTKEIAMTLVEVKEFYQTRPAYLLIIGGASFVGLMIVISVGISNYAISEILRFVFISGIIISVIASFLFMDEEIGTFSPVGLVRSVSTIEGSGDQSEEEMALFPDAEWVINIGGFPTFTMGDPAGLGAFSSPGAIYNTGIQIPVFVIIFGMVGGYLRYLYKSARLSRIDEELKEIDFKVFREFEKKLQNLQQIKGQINEEKERKSILELQEKTIKSERRKLLFYRSLEDLALLFLSPLLAVAVWFILIQWETTNANNYFTIAVVTFTVGLITDEIIQTLIRATQAILGTEKKKPEEVEDIETKPIKA